MLRRTAAIAALAVLTVSGFLAGIDPVAAQPEPLSASPDAVSGEVLVTYNGGASTEEKGRARSRAGAASARPVAGEVEQVVLAEGVDRDEAIAELRRDPAVADAQPNFRYQHQATALDPGWTGGQLWGLAGDASSPRNAFGSQAAEAWARDNVGADAVYVGVIDEGVQYDHPDLDANVWVNPLEVPGNNADDDNNGCIDDVRGCNFLAAQPNGDVFAGVADDHGTHVAGTIGAAADGKGVVGVSWNVTMIPAKFLGQDGGTTAGAIKAIEYFVHLKTVRDLNIVALNNSWGGGPFDEALLQAIVKAANADILFVAAAGNNGFNTDTFANYPSNYDPRTRGAAWDSVISVAAIDKAGSKPQFSNYGARTVDLAAPGVGIVSTYPTLSGPAQYVSYSGTSMATPHVSGAAALYKNSHPEASGAEIRTAILQAASATPTKSMARRAVTGGRLNAGSF